MHYHMQQAKHPITKASHEKHQHDADLYHAALTDSGIAKVTNGIKQLNPNADYQIREDGDAGWIPLGRGEHAQPYRHDWIVVPRKRPYVPVLYGAQGSHTEDEQAMRLLVLFFPWVNDVRDASDHVPFIGRLWNPGMKDWREALRTRVFRYGFPTEEAKRHVLNFCFVYCLPRSLQLQDGLAANSDNEGIEDEAVVFDEEDLLEATLTHVRGKGKAQNGGSNSQDNEESEDETGGNAKLYDLTMQMLHISDKLWAAADSGAGGDPAMQQVHQAMLDAKGVRDHALAKKAAKASSSKQKQSASSSNQGQLIVGANGPSVTERAPLTVDRLRQWLESDQVRRGTNSKQHQFLELVVDRVLVEAGLIQPEQSVRQTMDPLVWLLHGPPGTGKSHVLAFIRELFDKVMDYIYGLDYEVVAFQAVNAADLHGKTIHGAFGFNLQASASQAASEDVAKRLANWRWLILDEISLTDAKLLGKLEHRLKAVMPNASAWKKDIHGQFRPFAGINVILTGDFQQLPPPAGHYLADIPRSILDPNSDKTPEDALADHGKHLLWGGAVQGVTELVERERCKDEWWNQVVDEMRSGCLSETTWRYLHGYAVDGCALSDEEKASRRRVITSVEDPRLKQDKFKEAVAIVANNDARYQINKDRTRFYSQATGTPLRWSSAKDHASTEALQAEECDKQAKIRHWHKSAFFWHCTYYFGSSEGNPLTLVTCPGKTDTLFGSQIYSLMSTCISIIIL